MQARVLREEARRLAVRVRRLRRLLARLVEARELHVPLPPLRVGRHRRLDRRHRLLVAAELPARLAERLVRLGVRADAHALHQRLPRVGVLARHVVRDAELHERVRLVRAQLHRLGEPLERVVLAPEARHGAPHLAVERRALREAADGLLVGERGLLVLAHELVEGAELLVALLVVGVELQGLRRRARWPPPAPRARRSPRPGSCARGRRRGAAGGRPAGRPARAPSASASPARRRAPAARTRPAARPSPRARGRRLPARAPPPGPCRRPPRRPGARTRRPARPSIFASSGRVFSAGLEGARRLPVLPERDVQVAETRRSPAPTPGPGRRRSRTPPRPPPACRARRRPRPAPCASRRAAPGSAPRPSGSCARRRSRASRLPARPSWKTASGSAGASSTALANASYDSSRRFRPPQRVAQPGVDGRVVRRAAAAPSCRTPRPTRRRPAPRERPRSPRGRRPSVARARRRAGRP